MRQTTTFIPANQPFAEWQQRTGEREPDFSLLKAFPDLPPLLEYYDGRPVVTKEDWAGRKAEIRQLLCHYFLGTFPAVIPQLVQSEIVTENREKGATRQEVRLTFDTANRASFTMEVLIPDGDGPFPVLLTQANHRRWGLIALSRGYIVCLYPGADADDQTFVFKEAYPECDWTLIPRRAWLGSRALDYLLTLPGVDSAKIGITGHSRNGKQSLIAAAFDERITAVISSGSGAAGSIPYRFTSESTFLESVEFTTSWCPTWFHPRLRYFTGREHLLPIDTHGLLGLIAPRACLISSAYNDGGESTLGIEKNYAGGKKIYDFLGQPDALRIRWRTGEHPTNGDDIHSYIDWCDHAFGRGKADFPERWLHRFDWADWNENAAREQKPPVFETKEAINHKEKLGRIAWGLGVEPPGGFERGGRFIGGAFGTEAPYIQTMLRHDSGKPADVERVSVAFGERLTGNLYFRKDGSGPRPVVIWLHPYNYPWGTVGSYMPRNSQQIFNVLAEQGFVVMTFDQVGFGSRLGEGWEFYRRYPQWSRLGKMIRDVQNAVDFLTADEILGTLEVKTPLPVIDHKQIYALGYSLGGMIALYAGAMDERIAGVASFCGFTPMRTDTDMKHTGGIRRLWEWHSLQPRLGHYQGRESEIPYDFDDVISLIAPRPCLIVSHDHDREADHTDVVHCVERAREAWTSQGVDQRLTHLCLNDYNRFHPEQYQLFLNWLNGVAVTKYE